ncbi:MAG: uncharacterized protein A8A55_0521 [Amphiamblys sp. WSBS2006]|nr:MAG: uncharacterized protein A8A55_0521 [Amphiamblys sp. WSBS2006]
MKFLFVLFVAGTVRSGCCEPPGEKKTAGSEDKDDKLDDGIKPGIKNIRALVIEHAAALQLIKGTKEKMIEYMFRPRGIEVKEDHERATRVFLNYIIDENFSVKKTPGLKTDLRETRGALVKINTDVNFEIRQTMHKFLDTFQNRLIERVKKRPIVNVPETNSVEKERPGEKITVRLLPWENDLYSEEPEENLTEQIKEKIKKIKKKYYRAIHEEKMYSPVTVSPINQFVKNQFLISLWNTDIYYETKYGYFDPGKKWRDVIFKKMRQGHFEYLFEQKHRSELFNTEKVYFVNCGIEKKTIRALKCVRELTINATVEHITKKVKKRNKRIMSVEKGVDREIFKKGHLRKLKISGEVFKKLNIPDYDSKKRMFPLQKTGTLRKLEVTGKSWAGILKKFSPKTLSGLAKLRIQLGGGSFDHFDKERGGVVMESLRKLTLRGKGSSALFFDICNGFISSRESMNREAKEPPMLDEMIIEDNDFVELKEERSKISFPNLSIVRFRGKGAWKNFSMMGKLKNIYSLGIVESGSFQDHIKNDPEKEASIVWNLSNLEYCTMIGKGSFRVLKVIFEHSRKLKSIFMVDMEKQNIEKELFPVQNPTELLYLKEVILLGPGAFKVFEELYQKTSLKEQTLCILIVIDPLTTVPVSAGNKERLQPRVDGYMHITAKHVSLLQCKTKNKEAVFSFKWQGIENSEGWGGETFQIVRKGLSTLGIIGILGLGFFSLMRGGLI